MHGDATGVAAPRWRRSPWTSVGVWLIVIVAALMALNTARALFGPSDFARYMGLPLRDAADSGFVAVYALRAAFLGLAAAALLLRSEIKALALFTAVAVVMPVGDAILTATSGAPFEIVARHAASAVYLAVAAYALDRWVRSNAI
jgi:hypothetical protein